MQRKQFTHEVCTRLLANIQRVLPQIQYDIFDLAPVDNKESVINLCAYLQEHDCLSDDAIKLLAPFCDKSKMLEEILSYPEVLAKLKSAYAGEIDNANRPLRDLLRGMTAAYNTRSLTDEHFRLLVSDVFAGGNGEFCRFLAGLEDALGHYANHYGVVELVFEYYKKDFSCNELVNALNGMRQVNMLTPKNLERFKALSYLGDMLTVRIKRDFMGFPHEISPQQRLDKAFNDIKERVDAQLETVQAAACFLEASSLPAELALRILRYVNNDYKKIINEDAMLGRVQQIRDSKYHMGFFEYKISPALSVESALQYKR